MTDITATAQISRRMRNCIQRCTDGNTVHTEAIAYGIKRAGR
jgi:hypothetical protein